MSQKIQPLTISEEDYLNANGAGHGFGDCGLHRSVSSVGVSTRRRQLARQERFDNDLMAKKTRLRAEYALKVESGEIRKPSRINEMIRTAQGNDDNQAVKAARRILSKRGIDWSKA